MDSDPKAPLSHAASELTAAAVRHLFRNQIQAMTSMVGLFGRRLPPGEGRDAFLDLRARFEAATFGPGDEAVPDAEGRYEIDLGDVARRIAGHLDPDFRHRLAVDAEPIWATPKRAAVLSQILAEHVIELYRHGFHDGRPGSAELSVAPTADGGVRSLLVQTGPEAAEPQRDASDLGVAISESLVRSVRGTSTRSPEGPLSIEAVTPPENGPVDFGA
jgi:two-component sensor histidine kinase